MNQRRMAQIQCDFYSEMLQMSTSMQVLLPTSGKGPYPVLYLLHGWSDDHTAWTRWTSIERYVRSLGLAVVMPGVDKSYYCNMPAGLRYWDFVSEEVPALARSLFPLSAARRDNFVAGLSMGGSGAMRVGLNFPERYAAAGSFSGVLRANLNKWPERAEHLPIFGEQTTEGGRDDVFHLLARLVENGKSLPRLYQSCGTEDDLCQTNRDFRAHADALGVEMESDFRSGAHEWGFWDTDIRNFLDWLGLEPG